MQQMISQGNLSANDSWAEDVEDLLPEITALIVEDLHSPNDEQTGEGRFFENHKGLYARLKGNRPSFPLTDSNNGRDSFRQFTLPVLKGLPVHITRHYDPMFAVRSFIGGLSHNYNNLLMGIWGHASLITMLLVKDHPAQNALKHIEALIQNGANLMHLLFGFIAERRSAAKKLRYQQLVKEVEAYNQISGNQIDFAEIESNFVGPSKVQNRTQLADRMACMLDKMLTFVYHQRLLIDENKFESSMEKTHLCKIDALMKRGFALIRNLKFYATIVVPLKKQVDLAALVQHQSDEANANNHSRLVNVTVCRSIPRVNVDPEQIGYTLKQVVDNALQAVDENGKVHIRVSTLDSESPKDRCGVHMLRDCAVITITDNGKGMSMSTQARIFDPFFSRHTGQGRAGLGLAASKGIIKSHGGYIQVRSKPGRGSTFKLYLPIKRAA
jgi:signal transduction histidine kinase